MMNRVAHMMLGIFCLSLMSCAVMPTAVNEASIPDMSFPTLIAQAKQYIGKTVILGGYIIEVQNQKNQTRIMAIQAPLGMGQEPKSKDLSQGRLIILYDGFIDPEVYAKDRKITVAGKLLGSSATEETKEPFPYVRLQMDHIHLWPKEKPLPRDPYWDPWGYSIYPYPWGWRYPYWW